MTQDVQVTINVDRELKENADAIFGYLGLNMSNAINIFLRQAVDQKGIPFQVNTGYFEGLNAHEITKICKDSVNRDIIEKQKKGLPVARYDIESMRAYLENADGSREYV